MTPQVPYFRFLPPVRAKYLANEIDNPQVIGASHKYLQIYEEYTLETGRFFTEAENLNKREVCVIGAEIVDALFPNVNPLNKTLTVEGRKLMVIGTLDRKGKFLGQSRDNFLFIPIGTFRKFYPGYDDPILIIKLKAGADIDKARDEIINLLRVRRKVKTNDKNNFSDLHPGDRRRALQPADRRGLPGHGHHFLDRAARGRHRGHEHHAGLGQGAHPRDRPAQGASAPAAPRSSASSSTRRSS